MEKINMQFLVPEQRIQLIGADKNFFEGIIKTTSSDYFSIQIPTNQAFFKLFKTNDFIDFLLIREDSAYRCNSKVLGCKISDSMQLMLADVPMLLSQIERREYKRLSTVMEVEYVPLPDDKKYTSLKSIPPTLFRKLKKTFTVDISGGGAKIITYENEFTSNSLLLSMNICGDMKAICSVVRIEQPDKDLKHFKTALKFEDIDNFHRKKIIDFVNEKISLSIETKK